MRTTNDERDIPGWKLVYRAYPQAKSTILEAQPYTGCC